jgi:hypothetical protein
MLLLCCQNSKTIILCDQKKFCYGSVGIDSLNIAVFDNRQVSLLDVRLFLKQQQYLH